MSYEFPVSRMLDDQVPPATTAARGETEALGCDPSASALTRRCKIFCDVCGGYLDSSEACPTCKVTGEQPSVDLDASLDRLADTVNARLREYQQMLEALEAVDQWFYDSNISRVNKERALLEKVRAAIAAGREA